jgi:hypothetical protein
MNYRNHFRHDEGTNAGVEPDPYRHDHPAGMGFLTDGRSSKGRLDAPRNFKMLHHNPGMPPATHGGSNA